MINIKLVLALFFLLGSAGSSPYVPPKKTFMDLYVEVLLKHQCTDASAYACSKHGKGFCVVDDICLCSPGYTGKNCDEKRGVDPNFENCNREKEKSIFIRDWMEFNKIHSINVTWPSRTGITEDVAREKCLEVYTKKNPFKVICKDSRTDVEEEIMEKCLRGIKITSQLNAAYGFFLEYVTGISCSYGKPEKINS